jgi:hypothetical protein
MRLDDFLHPQEQALLQFEIHAQKPLKVLDLQGRF